GLNFAKTAKFEFEDGSVGKSFNFIFQLSGTIL
ncbi:hypothetical protein SAMN04488574_1708, partial [Bacillus sp. 71mf]